MLCEIAAKPLWLLPGHHYKNGKNTVHNAVQMKLVMWNIGSFAPYF